MDMGKDVAKMMAVQTGHEGAGTNKKEMWSIWDRTGAEGGLRSFSLKNTIVIPNVQNR